MKKIILVSLICLIIILTSCSNQKNETVDLTISAAASMQGALNELQKIYEKENKNVKIFFNFGSSGALQQQIEQGAPVDLFISASNDNFNLLLEKELIDKRYSMDFAGNELVLIQNINSKFKIVGFEDLSRSDINQIAIGTPEIVPAGKYAKETLANLNLWSKLEKKTVFAKDVRQVLTYVETGNVEAGIVYRTDAMGSKKVRMVVTADPKSHTPIVYPIGVVKDSKQKEEAKTFYQFLQTKKAINVFKKYGFTSLIE